MLILPRQITIADSSTALANMAFDISKRDNVSNFDISECYRGSQQMDPTSDIADPATPGGQQSTVCSQPAVQDFIGGYV